MTKIIGLTGGIASGKSVVAAMLADMGALVINGDEEGHKLFYPGTPAWHEVVEYFGEEIVAPNGEIDRVRLAKIIFDNPDARLKLDDIMHPKIRQVVKIKIDEARRQNIAVVAVEAALLKAINWAPMVNEIWLIVAPREKAVQRLIQRNKYTPEQALARIQSQPAYQERIKEADVVIVNDSDLTRLKARIKAELDRLLAGRPPKKDLSSISF